MRSSLHMARHRGEVSADNARQNRWKEELTEQLDCVAIRLRARGVAQHLKTNIRRPLSTVHNRRKARCRHRAAESWMGKGGTCLVVNDHGGIGVKVLRVLQRQKRIRHT